MISQSNYYAMRCFIGRMKNIKKKTYVNSNNRFVWVTHTSVYVYYIRELYKFCTIYHFSSMSHPLTPWKPTKRAMHCRADSQSTQQGMPQNNGLPLECHLIFKIFIFTVVKWPLSFLFLYLLLITIRMYVCMSHSELTAAAYKYASSTVI